MPNKFSQLLGEHELEGFDFSKEELVAFISKASTMVNSGSGELVKKPSEEGFTQLACVEDEWKYVDSFAGRYRVRGMELVRYKEVPVWVGAYGGGMTTRDRDMSRAAHTFLLQALSVDTKGFDSFRGPNDLTLGKWHYAYDQHGDVTEFWGEEKIRYDKELMFYRKIIGGMIEK